MTGSPISDLNPILMACGALLTFESSTDGRRQVVLDENFYTGYRKTNTKPEEVLLSIMIPNLTEVRTHNPMTDLLEIFLSSVCVLEMEKNS